MHGDRNDLTQIMWVLWPAGLGKTTITGSIRDRYGEKGCFMTGFLLAILEHDCLWWAEFLGNGTRSGCIRQAALEGSF